MLGIAVFDDPCRNAYCHGIVGQGFGYNRPCRNDAALTDGNSVQNGCLRPNPAVRADYDALS